MGRASGHESAVGGQTVNINLHIERLILDGVHMSHGERLALQASIEMELVNLLASDGLAPNLLAGGAMPRVRDGTVQLTRRASPADLGKQIAQAVYGGIGRRVNW